MVNYLAVVVAAVAAFAFGALWYSPILFGKKWMKLSGTRMGKKPKNVGTLYFGGFLTWVVMAYVLERFMGVTNVTTGLMTAFLAWLGFVATISFGGVLWDKKPLPLWVLNNSYNLLGLLIMGAILGAWP